MKSLYEPDTLSEILSRINKLGIASQRQWGKMEVAQMLAHCSVALEGATGQNKPPRLLIGRLLTPFIKSSYYNDKPFAKNTPTAPSFIIADQRDFDEEKTRLIQLTKQFSVGGPAKCTSHPHSFFGKLTPDEWSIGMYKHLDHHLTQFGV